MRRLPPGRREARKRPYAVTKSLQKAAERRGKGLTTLITIVAITTKYSGRTPERIQTTALAQALEREARLTPLKCDSLSLPRRLSFASPKSCTASSYNRRRPVLQEQRADSVFAGEAALSLNKHAKVRGSQHKTEPESASHRSRRRDRRRLLDADVSCKILESSLNEGTLS